MNSIRLISREAAAGLQSQKVTRGVHYRSASVLPVRIADVTCPRGRSMTMIKRMILTATLGLLGIAGSPRDADASPIVLNLDCVLKFTPCQPSIVYGTITLAQVGDGISVTVDLPGPRQKFRDLMLNYTGPATTITDNDRRNRISLTADGFHLNPYDRLFDVGGSGGKGWPVVRSCIPPCSPVTVRYYSQTFSRQAPVCTR